jgi:hypothetical protein
VRSWDGWTYFHNQRTNETAWQRPTELEPPPPSATPPPMPHSQRSPQQQLPPQPPQTALRDLAYKADLAERLAAWKVPQRGQRALARRRPPAALPSEAPLLAQGCLLHPKGVPPPRGCLREDAAAL